MIILLVVFALVVINLKVISGNIITGWIYAVLQWLGLSGNMVDANTIFTAITFSIMSFALSRILLQWNNTKEQRKERKVMRLKNLSLPLLTTEELLKEAKRKDEEKRKELE